MSNTKKKKKAVSVPVQAIIIIAVIALAVGLFIGLIILHFAQKNKIKEESGAASPVVTSVADGEPADYAESGNITIGKYKGVSAQVTPDEEEIQSAMQEKAESKKLQKKLENDNRIQKGDYVFIDYEGYVDGVSNEDLRAEDACLQIGKYEYVEDFENGLIGKEIGKTHTVTVHFDASYDDELVAGKKVSFSIDVLGKFDDAYAKEASGGKYKTVNEYKQYLKKKLKKENQETVDEIAWAEMIDTCEVEEYPEDLVKAAQQDLEGQYRNFAKVSGSSYEDLLASLNMDEETVKETAEETVRDRMVAKTIAKRENLTLTDEQYKKYLMETMEYTEKDNMSLEALISEYKRDYGGRPKDDMLVEVVKDFVGYHAKQK